MNIFDRIKKHGGIQAIHVTPVTREEDPYPKPVVGWQNIIVCYDGHREYPTLEEQKALAEGEVIPKGFDA